MDQQLRSNIVKALWQEANESGVSELTNLATRFSNKLPVFGVINTLKCPAKPYDFLLHAVAAFIVGDELKARSQYTRWKTTVENTKIWNDKHGK